MSKALCALQYLLVLAVGVGSTQAILAQEEDESKRSHEIGVKMTIRTTPPDEQICEATIYFQFRQKNTVAAVDSTLTNTDCAASSGSYSVLVRFRDEHDEMQSLEYPETWQRDDNKAIETHREYYIGDNVDLVTIRSRKLRCVCDKAGVKEDAPEE